MSIRTRGSIRNFLKPVVDCAPTPPEDYGKIITLRAWYQDGREVEFGFAAPVWVALPLDPGTHRVLQDGIFVVFERIDILSRAIKDLLRSKENPSPPNLRA